MHLCHRYGLEELMMEYNVDVGLWAHKHCYERLWPVYNYTVYKPDKGLAAEPDQLDPYTDPRAPLHVITGTAVRLTLCSQGILDLILEYQGLELSIQFSTAVQIILVC